MNEKLSSQSRAITAIEQQLTQQQQQQQENQQQPHKHRQPSTHDHCTAIEHADYHYEATAIAAVTTATTTTKNKIENITTLPTKIATTKTIYKSNEIGESFAAGLGVAEAENDRRAATGESGLVGSGNIELYHYASVASLDGMGGGNGTTTTTTTTTMSLQKASAGQPSALMDAYMTGTVPHAQVPSLMAHQAPIHSCTANTTATIVKMHSSSESGIGGGGGLGSNHSSRKGSNLNSPHKQQQQQQQQQQLGVADVATSKRDTFCDCFGCCGGGGGDGAGGGGGGAAIGDATSTSVDKQQQQPMSASLTFWPALFANLGICTLLLGYLFAGSFLFLTIETSGGDGGSAAGVVSDPSKSWTYEAQNAYISTQQQQEKLQKQAPLQSSFTDAQQQPVLYTTNGALMNARGGEGHTNATTRVVAVSVEGEGSEQRTGATALALTVAKQFGRPEMKAETGNSDNKNANKLPPPAQPPLTANTNANANLDAQQFTQQSWKRKSGEVNNGYRVGAAYSAGNDISETETDIDVDIVDAGEMRADMSFDTRIAMEKEMPFAGVVSANAAEVEYAADDMLADDAGGGGGGAWGGENVALQRTVENIWDITVSLNILYKENWTKLAALEINKFQDQLIKRLVMDLTQQTITNGVTGPAEGATSSQDQNYLSMKSATTNQVEQQQQQQRQRSYYWQLQAARQRQWQLQQKQQHFEWNFATSFLYSLTVVTTVGYGTITPRTTLGRMVTIVYATFGIPLTLVYLSSIGSLLAKLASGFCERLLCCCFCRSSANKRHTICGFSRQQVSDKKCNLKLQQLQKHANTTTSNLGQKSQQQQQHAATQLTQPAAHLPYCYVRPPAEDALSYAEHSSASPPTISSTTTCAAASRGVDTTLRWSLALPLAFCILLLLAYIGVGSLVIALLEQWSLFDGIYFCFMSLTTIGFCDLLPGVHAHARPLVVGGGGVTNTTTTTATATTNTVVVWFCAAYILSGLTLTSMCVNMLHDELLQRMRVVVKFKKLATGGKSGSGVMQKDRSYYGAPP